MNGNNCSVVGCPAASTEDTVWCPEHKEKLTKYIHKAQLRVEKELDDQLVPIPTPTIKCSNCEKPFDSEEERDKHQRFCFTEDWD
jgi:hypothetical protein